MLLDKKKVVLELTKKLIELDEVALEDEEIISRFERQHQSLNILVEKAKGRLINFEPIRSALQSSKGVPREEIDIKEMIMNRALNLDQNNSKQLQRRVLEHQSIKYQGDLYKSPKIDQLVLPKTNFFDKENNINYANDSEIEENEPGTFQRDMKSGYQSNTTHSYEKIQSTENLADKGIRERVQIMKKKKFCVF